MTEFSCSLGIQTSVICGAMYPCSNPELVAAASEAGAIGIIQPLSLSYVHGYDFREGLQYIRSLTDKPVGINFILEASSKRYVERTRQWLEIALEEGIQFFVTALGNPSIGQNHPVSLFIMMSLKKSGLKRRWMLASMDSCVSTIVLGDMPGN